LKASFGLSSFSIIHATRSARICRCVLLVRLMPFAISSGRSGMLLAGRLPSTPHAIGWPGIGHAGIVRSPRSRRPIDGKAPSASALRAIRDAVAWSLSNRFSWLSARHFKTAASAAALC